MQSDNPVARLWSSLADALRHIDFRWESVHDCDDRAILGGGSPRPGACFIPSDVNAAVGGYYRHWREAGAHLHDLAGFYGQPPSAFDKLLGLLSPDTVFPKGLRHNATVGEFAAFVEHAEQAQRDAEREVEKMGAWLEGLDRGYYAGAHPGGAFEYRVVVPGSNEFPVMIDGHERMVKYSEWRALRALHDARPGGLELAELVGKAGSDARKVLAALRDSAGVWREVIVFPGRRKAGGYRLS